MSNLQDDILTIDEAAAVLKVDAAIVQTLLEDQAIPGRQIGDEWRTTLRALVSYVDGVPIQGESSCCVPMQCCTPEGDSTGVIKCCVPGDSGCC